MQYNTTKCDDYYKMQRLLQNASVQIYTVSFIKKH